MTPHTELFLKKCLVQLAASVLLWAGLHYLAVKCFGATASAQPGQTVTLRVTADGTTPFSYQWFKNGTAIDGATSASYVLSLVKALDAGAYTAVVSNSAGSATSDTATLTLTPMQATLTASLVSINFPPQSLVQWRKNGQTILGANQLTYTFDPIAEPGSYSFTATWPNPAPLK